MARAQASKTLGITEKSKVSLKEEPVPAVFRKCVFEKAGDCRNENESGKFRLGEGSYEKGG